MKLSKIWLLMAVLAMIVVAAPRVWAQEEHAAPAAENAAAAVEHGAAQGAVHGEAAGHGEAPGHSKGGLVDLDLGTAIFTILIFVALLAVLRATAWKPILSGLKSREQAIREGLEAAAKAKTDAEKTTKELEAKISEVQQQGAKALAQAKTDALKLADTIRTQAEAEAVALKSRTLQEIDAAKQQAISEINEHAAELGTAVARKILQREVKVEDQKRLVEESLGELAAARN